MRSTFADCGRQNQHRAEPEGNYEEDMVHVQEREGVKPRAEYWRGGGAGRRDLEGGERGGGGRGGVAEDADLEMGDQGGGEGDMGPMKDKRGGGGTV